jgi:predicted ATPase/DNA-binding CsgD family transcriptional regulator
MQHPNPDDPLHPPLTQVTHLTQREQDILQLVGQALSNQEIAERLVLSIGTVRWYVKQIYSKLDVHSREEAITKAAALTPTPAHQPQPITPNNLPARTTPLVGREREIHTLRELLFSSAARLVTLVGTPGIGKTRLSIETAFSLLNEFSDGVFFIALAPLNSPGLVADAVVQALGLHEVHPANVIDLLKNHLRAKHTLLIFDNFEHVLEAASLVSELLVAVPDLKVLATSREPLHIYGEQEYDLPALSLPRSHDLQALMQSESVALFVERARLVKPDFALTPENAPAVGQICTQLDGLPLAIELAAARIKLFPPLALLGRLHQRLRTLTASTRDLEARHQTLRAAIDWSYQLLNADEKRLYARLGVFAGGWTLEALAAVCAPALTQDGFETLESLITKSLVTTIAGVHDEPRFSMLETLREFALEQLEASGDRPHAQAAHAAYFLSMAETADRLFRTPASYPFYDRLEADLDNLRAALDYYHQQEETIEPEFRMIAGLGGFWHLRAHGAEGVARAQAALERDHPQLPNDVRAGAYWALGYAYYGLGQDSEWARAAETALVHAREATDVRWLLLTLQEVSSTSAIQGDTARGITLAEEALALVPQLGNDYLRIRTIQRYQTALVYAGEAQRAAALLDDLLILQRQLKDVQGLAFALSVKARDLNEVGDHESALQAALEGLEAARQIDQKHLIFGLLDQQYWAEFGLALYQAAVATADRLIEVAEALNQPAYFSQVQLRVALATQAAGDTVRATQALRRALELAPQTDEAEKLFTLLDAGIIFTQRAEHAVAARFYGLVDHFCHEQRLNWQMYFNHSARTNLEVTQAALGEEAYSRFAAEGEALTMEQAWALAFATLADRAS